MGMDVSGKNPTSEKGKYFRNNVWWWHPLWSYCCEVMPDLSEKAPHGHTNDGAGLDDAGSKELAALLRDEIEAGRTEEYSKRYSARLDAMAEETCDLCKGTKVRPMEPNKGAVCNVCEGTGLQKPFEAHYPFSTENVAEFAAFLEDSGGFEIW